MLVLAAFLLVLGPMAGQGSWGKKPNILHILVDDFGWADGKATIDFSRIGAMVS